MQSIKYHEDEWYKCPICGKKSHKEFNSYSIYLTPLDIVIGCRNCWRTCNRIKVMLKKIKEGKNPI